MIVIMIKMMLDFLMILVLVIDDSENTITILMIKMMTMMKV